jgi:hypothetical protein
MYRQPRTIRSTCAAVPDRPTVSKRASVSGVATRVRARTFAYDSSPRARAWANSGSVARARATRTFSRAAPRSSPIRQLSQSAQERNPALQPPRASNSRIRSRRRAVAASRCADSSAISSPRRSSSATGPRVVRMCVEWTSMASLPSTGETLHPGFGATLERSGRAMWERAMIFGSGPARPAIAGPVRAAGPAPGRHGQASAVPSRLGCQVENAGAPRRPGRSSVWSTVNTSARGTPASARFEARRPARE